MNIELNFTQRMVICSVTGKVEGSRADEKRNRAFDIFQKTALDEDEQQKAKVVNGVMRFHGRKVIDYTRLEIVLILSLLADADFFPVADEQKIREVEKLLDEALSHIREAENDKFQQKAS